MRIKAELILEDPKTRIKKAIEWLKLQEKRELKKEGDVLTEVKRKVYILEALASLKKQMRMRN